MDKFNIELANQMVNSGSWENGLNYIWDHIDKRDLLAVQTLAEIFEFNGLFAFSHDHWPTLIDVGGEFATRGRVGMFGNFLWIRDFESAQEVISSDNTLDHLNQEVVEQKDKYDLTKFSNFLASTDELLIKERIFLQKLQKSFTVEAQIELLKIRDMLAVTSSLISFPARRHLGALSVSFGISGSEILRPLSEVIGTPEAAWWRTAQSASVLIDRIRNQSLQENSELLTFAANQGHIALQKMFLHKGLEKINEDDKVVISYVAWALEQIGEFSSFIYGGLL